MSILNSFLIKTSSVKKICISFFASQFTLLIMMLYTFPIINSQIGTRAFDLQNLGYSLSTANQIVNNLNNQTTELYLFPQLTLLDVFYPFLLALFLSSLLFRLGKLIGKDNKITSLLLYLPLLAMAFDYFENICIILMISKSIEISKSFVLLSSTFTVLKSLLTTFSWIVILIYTIKWVRLKIMKKATKSSLSQS
ncbi:hypothetical protein CLV91_2379 [Maribacter vaceletii]|uniref:Uncharacterized protein n=1 Tax=Maribacter vaceletii TaxID=1206816 RepID=A0A495E6V9_9FLAO|nr:hypothetical protein [Maribacter vaceletii]RKR12253.1 hypothetical protein CLV91_2379 [Maribacter vaceletii]